MKYPLSCQGQIKAYLITVVKDHLPRIPESANKILKSLRRLLNLKYNYMLTRLVGTQDLVLK